MRRFSFALLSLAFLALPLTASALRGIGPRVNMTGFVREIHITERQAFNKTGGEFIVEDENNGQLVTITLGEGARVITEGKISRRTLAPTDVVLNARVRVFGWRLGSDKVSASLFIVTNLENNSALTGQGVLQSIGNGSISVLFDDGVTRTYSVGNATIVTVSYELSGSEALSLLGKQVFLTFNPQDRSEVKFVRITGNPEAKRG